jgi:hypothetical protein
MCYLAPFYDKNQTIIAYLNKFMEKKKYTAQAIAVLKQH